MPKNLFFLINWFFFAVPLLAGAQLCQFEAKYLYNYDGDTFIALVKLPTQYTGYDFEEKKVKCRLYQCDTYEMTSNDTDEAAYAQAAKYFTKALLKRKPFVFEYKGKDKYGRWLVVVRFRDGTTLKERLYKKGYLTGKYDDFQKRITTLKY